MIYLWNYREKHNTIKPLFFKFERAYLGLMSNIKVYTEHFSCLPKKKRKRKFRQKYFNVQTTQSFLHTSLKIIKCYDVANSGDLEAIFQCRVFLKLLMPRLPMTCIQISLLMQNSKRLFLVV